ncbi:hypothetical protein ACP275_12G111500 [Erythranthe tilingii]
MASDEVKLLGAWPSPYVLRARIALNIKRVNYEFLEEKFGTKSDLLLKSNPVHKKIPVLIHGENPIAESLIIVQYIDDFWASGPQILPSDPYNRAVARFWAAYIDDKWYPNARAILMADEGEAKKAALQGAIEGLNLLEDAFLKCSNGGKFFGGDEIGYLDIALGGFLGWIRVIERMGDVTLIGNCPNLLKWGENFAGDDSVKDVLPETEKLFEVAKFIVAKTKASAKH